MPIDLTLTNDNFAATLAVPTDASKVVQLPRQRVLIQHLGSTADTFNASSAGDALEIVFGSGEISGNYAAANQKIVLPAGGPPVEISGEYLAIENPIITVRAIGNAARIQFIALASRRYDH